MAKKGSSKHKQNLYSIYKTSNTFAKNKRTKLERHLKKHPNDIQTKEVLEKGKFEYSRKESKAKMWSSTTKKYAQLIKYFIGSFNLKMLSSDMKEANAAYEKSKTKVTREKVKLLNQFEEAFKLA